MERPLTAFAAVTLPTTAQQPGSTRPHDDAASMGDPSNDDNDGHDSSQASAGSVSEDGELDSVDASQHATPAIAADHRATDEAYASVSHVGGSLSCESPLSDGDSDEASATTPGAQVDRLNNGERATAAATAAKILLSACAPKESASAVDRHGLRSYYDLGGGLSDTCDEFFITGSTSGRRRSNDGGPHDDGIVLDTVPEQFDDALPDDRSSSGSGKGNSVTFGPPSGSCNSLVPKARRIDGAWPVAIDSRFFDRLAGGHSDGSSSLGTSPAALSDFSAHDLSDHDGAAGGGLDPHERQGYFRGRKGGAGIGLSRYANSEDLSSIVAGAQLPPHDVSPDTAGSCSPASSSLRWDESGTLEPESTGRIRNVRASAADIVSGSSVDATESLGSIGSHGSDSIQQQLTSDGQAPVFDAPCNADVATVGDSSVVIAIGACASPPEARGIEANDSAQSPASVSFASSSCNSVVRLACLDATPSSPEGANGQRSPLTAPVAATAAVKDEDDAGSSAIGQPAAQSATAADSLSHGFREGEDGSVGRLGVECTMSESVMATTAPAAARSRSPADRAASLAKSPAVSVLPSSSLGQTDYGVVGRRDSAEKAATLEASVPSAATSLTCGDVCSLQPAAGQTTAFAQAGVKPGEAAAGPDRHLELTVLQRMAPAACSTPLSHRQRIHGNGGTACSAATAAASKSAAAEMDIGDEPILPVLGRTTTPTQRPAAATAACPLQCLLSPRARVAATSRTSHDGSRMSRTAPHSMASSSGPLAAVAYNQSTDFMYETLPLSPRRKYFHVVQRMPVGSSDVSGSAPSLLGLSLSLGHPLGEGESHLAAEPASYSESVFIDCRPTGSAARQHPAVPPLHLDELDVAAECTIGPVSTTASPLLLADVSSSIGGSAVGGGMPAARTSFVTSGALVETELRRRLHASADSVAGPYSGHERLQPENRSRASTVGRVAKPVATSPSNLVSSTLYVGAVRSADLNSRAHAGQSGVSGRSTGTATKQPPGVVSSTCAVVAHVRHPQQLPAPELRRCADSSPCYVSASPAGDLVSGTGEDRRDRGSVYRPPVVVRLTPRSVECAATSPSAVGSISHKAPAASAIGDRWSRSFRSETDLWPINKTPSAASLHDDLGCRLRQHGRSSCSMTSATVPHDDVDDRQQEGQRCRSSAVWTSESGATTTGAAGKLQLELSPLLGSADRPPEANHGAPIVHVFRAAPKTATPTRRLQMAVLSPAPVACDQSNGSGAEDTTTAAALGGTQGVASHPHYEDAPIEERSSDDENVDVTDEGYGSRRVRAAERLCSPALPKAHLTLTYSISAASISDGSGSAMPLCGDEVDGDSAAGRLVSLPATVAAANREEDLVVARAPGVTSVSDSTLGSPACGDGEAGTAASVPDRHVSVSMTDGRASSSTSASSGHQLLTGSVTTQRDGHRASNGSDGDTDVASDDESTINDRSQASSTAAGEGEGAAATTIVMATSCDVSSSSAPAVAAADTAVSREQRESSTETVKGSACSGGRHGSAAAAGASAAPTSPGAVGSSAACAKGVRGSHGGGGRRKRKAGKRAAQRKTAVSDIAVVDDGAAETGDATDSARVSTELEHAAKEQQQRSLEIEVSRGGDSAGAVRTAEDDSDAEMAASAEAAAADVSSICADESDVVPPPDISSLSETAWDDYLEKYNTTELDDPDDVGSDESLEQLDDGCLQWEDELSSSTGDSLDDSAAGLARGDFGVVSGDRRRRGGGVGGKVLRRGGSETDDAAVAALPPTAVGGGDDDEQSEDSDLEDLHHVIEESSDQLLASERSLKKIRRDPFNYGIGLEPSRYSEVLATCRTNIKCLQVITGHLGTGQGLPNLTDDDIQRMLDLVDRWRHLERAAAERERQATALARVCQDISSFRRAVAEAESELTAGRALVDGSVGGGFDDVRQLEAHVRVLQTKRPALLALVGKLSQVDAAVIAFETMLAMPTAASVAATSAGVALSTTQLPSVAPAATVACAAPAASATDRVPTAAAAAARAGGGSSSSERPPGPRSSVADLQAVHKRCLASYAERTAELQQHVLLWHEFDENFRDLDYLVSVAEGVRSSPAAGSDQRPVAPDAASSRDGCAIVVCRCSTNCTPSAAGVAATCAVHSESPSSLAAHGQCLRVVSGVGSDEDEEDDVATCERRLSELRSLSGRLAAAVGVTNVCWRSRAEASLAALALRIDRLRQPTTAAASAQANAEQALCRAAAANRTLGAEKVERTAASPASCAKAVIASTATAALSDQAARKRAGAIRVPQTAASSGRAAQKKAAAGRVSQTAVDLKRTTATGSAKQSELTGQRHQATAAANGSVVSSSRRRRRLPFIIGSWIAIGLVLLLAVWLQPACCDFTRCRRWPWLQALGFDLEPPAGGLPPV